MKSTLERTVRIVVIGVSLGMVVVASAAQTTYAAPARPNQLCGGPNHWVTQVFGPIEYVGYDHGQDSVQSYLLELYDQNNDPCWIYYGEGDAYVVQGGLGGGTVTATMYYGSSHTPTVSTPVGGGGLHGTDYLADTESINAGDTACVYVKATWDGVTSQTSKYCPPTPKGKAPRK